MKAFINQNEQQIVLENKKYVSEVKGVNRFFWNFSSVQFLFKNFKELAFSFCVIQITFLSEHLQRLLRRQF